MRARLLKPGFFKSEQLAECSIFARLLFAGLWTIADRRGRLEDRPKRIKGELFPYDDPDVHALLDELQAHKLLVRYEVGSVKYIQVLTFEKHQSCHVKEPESTIPAPDSHQTSTSLAEEGSIPAQRLSEAEAEAVAEAVPEAVLKRDVGGTSVAVAREAPREDARANNNGAIEKIDKSKAKGANGQAWGDRIWVAATALTVDVPQRPNEPFDDWKDRVYAAVQIRKVRAATEGKTQEQRA